jgi:hemolysin activation/secretion protein
MAARIGAVLALAAGPALAQPASSIPTQELLRQQERERLLRTQQERTPDAHMPRPAPTGLERLPSDEADCVLIKAITLTGDAAEQFQWALSQAHQASDGTPDPASGCCLGTRGVNLAMRRIQNALIARGFTLAKVLAGPQRYLQEGTLELTLFPGRIRRIGFADGHDPRATQWNAMPTEPGDVFNLRDIEQALENFKRVPTAQADVELRAAEGPDAAPGQTDVVIRWKQGFPFRLSLSADDSGSRATGKYQGTATLSYDHWWTLNDLFYVSVSRDLGGGDTASARPRGTRGFTAHYSAPFGYWLLGLTTSAYRYHQSVAGASQTYLYSGRSRNSELKLARVLYRDAVRKTTAFVRCWTRASSNAIDDTEIEVQRRRMAGWGGGISHREFAGTAIVDAALDYRHGTAARRALQAPEEAFDEGTSRPRMLSADAQLQAPFSAGGQRLRYLGAWRAQWNRTSLVPQDRFAIGGRYTVRGFDGQTQLIAERGWLVRNEVGVALGASGQELYAGIDYGQVSGLSSDTLIGKHLGGAVLGLRGGIRGFAYDLFVGAPLSKPAGLRTSRIAAGFSVNWSL